MQTHRDDDFEIDMESLERKAHEMTEARENVITAGEAETAVRQWKHKGTSVTQMPDDEHGLLRISIGGSPTNARPKLAYCVFRGDRVECRRLLSEALKALQL